MVDLKGPVTSVKIVYTVCV